MQLNFIFECIKGLHGLFSSVRQLYLTLLSLPIIIAVIINNFVESALTKSNTLTCAKTKHKNLSSIRVTNLHHKHLKRVVLCLKSNVMKASSNPKIHNFLVFVYMCVSLVFIKFIYLCQISIWGNTNLST